MTYLAKATVQDSLSPEALAEIAQSFGLDLQPSDYVTEEEFITEEWLQAKLGMVTSSHLWDAMWLFGIVVDDDLSYYVPDDFDTTVSIIDLEASPPEEDCND